MLISDKVIYCGIILPTVVYISLISHLMFTIFSTNRVSPPQQTLTWSQSVPVERRKELVLNRSEPVLAYEDCLSGRGEWYHLEHFSDDVVFQDPLFRLEGREELSAVFVTLTRRFLEDVLLDIISVKHNEELVTLELVAHITPVLMPSFSIPIKSHLHFEEDGEHQRIYKIKEEWNGVLLINEGWLGRAHSWLRRSHAVIATFLATMGYLGQ